MPAATYPLMAGVRLDASSIELNLNGKRYIGISEMEYEQTLEPGTARGLSAQVLGYTRGIHSCSGRLVIMREEFQDLSTDLQSIAAGLLESSFFATIVYSELPPFSSPALSQVTSTDTIWGMRFSSHKHRFAAGSSDPIAVEMPFVARLITVNGIFPLNNVLRYAVASVAA